MVKAIIWRKKVILKVESIALYLETEFSTESAEKFVASVYEAIDKIKEHPSRGRKVPAQKAVQFINVDKNRQLFYRLQKSDLILLDIFDVRQNPDKRPYRW